MASLSSLPLEIVLIIGTISDGQATFNLSYTCRRLYSVVHPLAFKTVSISRDNIWKLSCLSHLFAQDPSCAQAIRELKFVETRAPLTLNKVQYDPAVIRPLLVGANDDELATHEGNLKAGQSYWPWLAILLPLVTNLEDLYLAIDDLQPYERELLHQTTSPKATPVLPRLDKAWISHWNEKCSLSSAAVIPFLRLPALSKLSGRLFRDSRDGEMEEDDDSPSSEIEPFNVTDLWYSSYSVRGCSDLIDACKQLKQFSYKHDTTFRPDLPIFEPRGLYRSLRRHRESLEDVSIARKDTFPEARLPYMEPSFIGSFKDFPRIKRLDLSARHLINWDDLAEPWSLADVLPPSVEVVSIIDSVHCQDPGWLHRQMLEMHREAVADDGGRYPKLHRCFLPGPLTIPSMEIMFAGHEILQVARGKCNSLGPKAAAFLQKLLSPADNPGADNHDADNFDADNLDADNLDAMDEDP